MHLYTIFPLFIQNWAIYWVEIIFLRIIICQYKGLSNLFFFKSYFLLFTKILSIINNLNLLRLISKYKGLSNLFFLKLFFIIHENIVNNK
ncbi:hypothetical protein GpSGHVEth019 [Glossina pallidipes salivary gland hypertrophy virus]|uniref:Uncharacterized protein n=1 Tax=Glossina hytrovirus (isolate Glossina pallidipes/Ethiopia/Seibersdorf/-) TaxID=379529 RepID=A0A0Y0LSY3_GHVS|nr:hypothetical protein GpSGHVEth019 [Glossina pallidipes salivary gland hypertrophy virus]